MPSLGPAAKEEQSSYVAYKFLCSCGDARGDRFCVRRHTKMRDFGEERVHPLTLCPNSDAAMIVAFAHKAGSSERDTVNEPLKAVREVNRSAMSGAESAPSLENR